MPDVRHADPDRDAAACAAIYAPHVDPGPASFEAEPPSRDEVAARIRLANERYAWLVAEHEGAVSGFAYASEHNARAGYRWSVDVAVYVDGSRQRTGAGRALYTALLGLLERQGLHTACAGISLPNPGSVGLHEAFGFELVGVYQAIGYKDGGWRDVGWYQRDLAPRTSGAPREPLGPQHL